MIMLKRPPIGDLFMALTHPLDYCRVDTNCEEVKKEPAEAKAHSLTSSDVRS